MRTWNLLLVAALIAASAVQAQPARAGSFPNPPVYGIACWGVTPVSYTHLTLPTIYSV